MNKVLLALPFLISMAFALPPIEGGKSVSPGNTDYEDIIKLEMNYGSCTGTKISPTLILTAAHCVSEVERQMLSITLSPGFMLEGVGVVKKVTIHPKYEEWRLKKIAAPKDKPATRFSTLYDVAFIEVEEKAEKRTRPYPKIISETNKPKVRKKVEIAGFGKQNTAWDGTEFRGFDTPNDIKVAENEWTECPINYQSNSLDELAAFNSRVLQFLSIRDKRVHTITNSNEVVSDGKGMILSGDSGSPALERDKDNKFIISGVASGVVNFDDGSGEAEFEIEVDGKIVTSEKLNDMPADWGLAKKSDNKFPVILNKLKAQNLLTPTGDIKPGVQIKRIYTRYTTGNFADLSHPENQNFIESIVNK